MAGSEPTEAPLGTVTFLFTDIEGSTGLVRRLKGDFGNVLELHNRVLRDAFASHGGHEVDTQGDSFLVAFQRARDAVEAAAEGQRSLRASEWPADVEVRVRMGIHTTEPGVRSEGYHGLGVVRGARICAAGHGGQVLLSAATRALIDEDELEGMTVRDLGEHRLKGIEQPERIHELSVEGVGGTFPPLRTAAVPLGVAGREGELAAAAEAAVAGPERRFGILGPLEVHIDGTPLELGGHKQRGLLALLLLDAGRPVATDHLLDALWGEHPPRTAATSLQNMVSQLRKLLGAETIETKSPGYRLRIADEELDARRFESLVSRSRGEPPAERAETLRGALGLWRGPPLADFTFDAFAQNEIGRLGELRLNALEQRIEADLVLGRHDELVGELESLVSAHPLRERLRGQLMLALYRGGRQAEALQAFQDARRALVDELGIEPGPALHELHKSILRQESVLVPSTERARPDDHFEEVMEAILAGRVVPVLGADVAELSHQLAERFVYPDDDRAALARVAQYVAVMKGIGPLHDELHALLEQEAAPTDVHSFFAALPRLLRERGVPQQLIVTTSFDLALEQAFVQAGEEFDVVTYLASGRHRGRFCHITPTGDASPILVPNEYVAELALDERPVILKLHGQVERSTAREWESFVVTEDDYIDFLAETDVSGTVPASLAARLRRSHYLFLGYTMRDWNLRVVLNRLWGDNELRYRSWAVHSDPSPLEREFWRRRDVDVFDVPLVEYVTSLARCLGLERAGTT